LLDFQRPWLTITFFSEDPKTRKAPAANVILFPVMLDRDHKIAAEAATKFHAMADAILMRSLRRNLASAEAKAAFGDAEAAVEADYFRLSIKRRLRDREKIIAGLITTFSRIRRLSALTLLKNPKTKKPAK
jgi:hypothetical protein